MQEQYKVLVLTDHTNHSGENSLYALVRAMSQHPLCGQIDVATRANAENNAFFTQHETFLLSATQAREDFEFSPTGKLLKQDLRQVVFTDYDLVWLRLPPPLTIPFLAFLKNSFPKQCIINNPAGIYETGSKSFLTHFEDCCPPMKICQSVEDIVAFKNQFPIVLKPFREYGGRGIVRIDGNKVWQGQHELSFDEFVMQIQNTEIAYLGVKFLKNVSKGDKRIVVVNGKIIGASLRLPAKGSWLCNVSMGGSSNFTVVNEEEQKIIERINPMLSKMGIVMYGVDTLVNDEGKRILSEINTTSIGGLPQIARMTKKPLVEEAIDLIWQYFTTNKIE